MPSTRHEPTSPQKRRKQSIVQRQDAPKHKQNSTVGNSSLERLPTELLYEIAELYLSFPRDSSIMIVTQVCRRLRQVVFGISSVWRSITLQSRCQPFAIRYGYHYGRMVCTTQEQLAFVLEHTSAGPLDLHILWPVVEGTLELIASKGLPIESLSVRNEMAEEIFWKRFANLNLDSLQLISPYDLDDAMAERFFDLPLGAQCNNLTLSFTDGIDMPSGALLSHELMQRVEKVIFHTRDYEEDFLEYAAPVDIALPQVKSWDLVAPTEALTFFDLSGAETLHYKAVGSGKSFVTAFIPSRLKEMYIWDLNFTMDSRSRFGANIMPNLTTLALLNVRIEGPVNIYLKFPQLKTLYLHVVSFFSCDASELQKEMCHRKCIPLSTAISFQNLPDLEALSLGWIHIDGEFARAIQHCPYLTLLETYFSDGKEFIPSLIESLADSRSFPSLQKLRFGPSLSASEDGLCQELAKCCALQRPDLVVCVSK
ncbi:hypothetical protein CPB86DRAFT_812054 [Serendipita vermifera]|nr:hypothetical protein CPB86DRAFT_812054 [Serendipita vermifera]